MELFLIFLAIALMLTGIVGCVLPMLPGPPLSFVALLIAASLDNSKLDKNLLIATGVATLLTVLLELLIPIWTTKKFGGSKTGVWGATIGVVLGLFIFPPVGLILGPFLGAFIGEMINDSSDTQRALNAALGSFVGFLIGTGLKLIVCIWMLVLLVKDLWGYMKWV